MNPTTAGDFCRRFKQSDTDSLMQAINEARINVWKQQDDSFFDQALIDVDGMPWEYASSLVMRHERI
ncbi:MAG: hypothetical protein NTV29_00460 [Planctomycetota bacterium]|nr:hypothetical protein [Planctomycetota bacterium]